MKRFILCISLILISTLSLLPQPQYTLASTRYARVSTSTEIYRSTSGSIDISNIYCLAEETYFVEIIGEYEEYYRVIYNSINGYVKRNDVQEISNTPSTPYPYNIKIVIGSNCNLRSAPTTNTSSNNILTTIYSGESNITFIGRIYSEEAIDFGGTTWYYVNYNGTYGYIYSKYCKSITPIYPNQEEVTYLSAQSSRITNPITHTPSLIIVIILLLPCIALLLILYLPKSHKKKAKPKKSPKIFDRY